MVLKYFTFNNKYWLGPSFNLTLNGFVLVKDFLMSLDTLSYRRLLELKQI